MRLDAGCESLGRLGVAGENSRLRPRRRAAARRFGTQRRVRAARPTEPPSDVVMLVHTSILGPCGQPAQWVCAI
jgi:hypothetical protein